MGGKQRTHNEFIELIKNIHPDIEILTPFIGTRKRITILCKRCNIKSTPFAQELLKPMFRCGECNRIERETLFIEKMSVINPNIKIIGEYKNSQTKVDCKCLIHDEFFSMTGCNLITGHGCPKCAKESRRKLSAKNHNEFVSELKKISPTINIKSEYISAHKKIKCQCSICNFEWDATPHSLLRGDRCSKCNFQSKGEIEISKILDELKIEYIQQKRFDDCRNQLPLPFDFYLPRYNICIEFQGRQHYEAVFCFGGEDEFRIGQQRDDIKANYCKEKNIGLLCIPYWDFNNIKQIINIFLNERRS
ncbi:MAG: hypothetical protein LC100_16785 [Chitinophagales bacterium]|nr:hypothetical protein [Chitinophagales bacterium]